MRVTMRTTFSGYRDGEPWPEVGQSVDVPDHEAADLIANGYAKEATNETPAVEPDEATTPNDGPQTVADDGGATGDEPAEAEPVAEVAAPKPKRTRKS